MHVMKRNRSLQILDLFREAIGQPSEAAHRHSHREVLLSVFMQWLERSSNVKKLFFVRARRQVCTLAGFVSFFGHLPDNHAFYWVKGANMPKVCETHPAESVAIINAPEAKQAATTVPERLKTFRGQSYSRKFYGDFGVRSHRAVTLVRLLLAIRVKLGSWQLVKIESGDNFNVVSWGLAAIAYNNPCLRRSLDSWGGDSIEENICPQLTFGVFLAGLPEQLSVNEERNGENRHNERAKRVDSVPISVSEFQQPRFIALAIFFFGGPLIGFGLLFVNEWLGRAVLVGWLLLFLDTLSGGWLR